MKIWTDLWELFFPRCCVVCGRRLQQSEEYLCLHCLGRLPLTGMHRHPDNPMEKQLWGKFPLGRATSFLYYAKEGYTQKVVFALKYYGVSRLGIFLGRRMAAELMPSGFFQDIDYLVPVPLHEKKKRQRGYNQSEMLAEGISSVTGIPVSDRLVIRGQFTETQTRMKAHERWTNVSGAFVCSAPEAFEGKHILLVDDVMTTGSTLVSCADALSGVSRLRISVLTLALAGRD